ncbi:MAG: hypothetical protein KGL39_52825 [Patescibacteria group bacterium]|nr:hypothetical protein [Patescibacteria group bacterium]
MKPTNTTRMYPRTTLEAFGCRGDLACAVERPHSKEALYGVLLAIAIGIFMVLALMQNIDEKPVNEPNPCGENGVIVDGKCYTKHGKKVTK